VNRLFGFGLGKCCDCACCGGGNCTLWAEDWLDSGEIAANWSVSNMVFVGGQATPPAVGPGSVQRITVGDVHSVTTTLGVSDLNVASNMALVIASAGFADSFGIAVVSSGDGSPALWFTGSAAPVPIPSVTGSSAVVTAQWSTDGLDLRLTVGDYVLEATSTLPLEIVFLQGEGESFVGEVTTGCDPFTPDLTWLTQNGEPWLTQNGEPWLMQYA